MAGENPAYIRIVKAMPCRLAATGRCVGAVEAHHPTHLRQSGDDKRRAHDFTAIPLCHSHHVAELHGLSGFFRTFNREDLVAWQTAEMLEVQGAAMPRLSMTLPEDAL